MSGCQSLRPDGRAPPPAAPAGPRRDALLKGLGLAAAAAGGGIACAPPATPRNVAPAQLYVSLARDRVVAILDSVTDRVVQRLSLASLGRQGHASQIAVGPNGAAAVIGVSGTSTDVGLVCPTERAPGAAPAQTNRAGALALALRHADRLAGRHADPQDARCERVAVVEGEPEERRTDPAYLVTDKVGARLLTRDDLGRAYVVVSDAVGRQDSSVTVLDLDSGSVLRHLPLGRAGERIAALTAAPNGSHLFAAMYPVATRGASGPIGPTRLLALDTETGRVLADSELPRETGAVSAMVVGPAPQGAAAGGLPAGAQALYVALANQAPHYQEDDSIATVVKPLLLALDIESMEPVDLWGLDHTPAGVAVRADGRRAYILLSSGIDGPWARELISLSLVDGSARRWPVPSGAFALELSPVGKLYIADTLGDQIWRLDTRTDNLLTPLSLPGAPLALGSRPA